MALYIDGRRECDAILGYPRLDVRAAHPHARPQALLSGFRCEFDCGRLGPGLHRFEFRAQTDSESATFACSVHKQNGQGPVLVTDVYIDIVGVCNLRCAMRPHGDLDGLRSSRRTGFMPTGLFERVVLHLQKSGFLREQINLYNWGEPLLHPQLEDILGVCRKLNLKVVLSSQSFGRGTAPSAADRRARRAPDSKHFRLLAGDLP